MEKTRLNIAVVGAGVAGLTAAYLLHKRNDITIFEKNDYPGGHTHTIELPDGPDRGMPVDTGFIVMNHRNYPLFTRLLDRLKVPLKNSEMSFSYYDEASGFQYSGNHLNGLFAQRKNLINLKFYTLVFEIFRFFKQARSDLESSNMQVITLGEYLNAHRFSSRFIHDHILPMGAAIWSTPCVEMLNFPAAAFIRFLHNHGLLSIRNRPQWKTVDGGSYQYVKKMFSEFSGTVRLNTPVESITRSDGDVCIGLADGNAVRFDVVIVAAHADEAFQMLSDPTEAETRLLKPWKYQPNRITLHSDPAVMPTLKRAWASWNYMREIGDIMELHVTLSYDMKRLQRLPSARPYFLTLNRVQPLETGSVIRELTYHHPTYTQDSMATQRELAVLNGINRTYFCGSYFGFGFMKMQFVLL